MNEFIQNTLFFFFIINVFFLFFNDFYYPFFFLNFIIIIIIASRARIIKNKNHKNYNFIIILETIISKNEIEKVKKEF